jgi:hypothetical protein
VALLIWLLTVPATAGPRAPGSGDAAAIRAVIEAQIAAFRADDGAAAFAFASPEIQSLFGDAERFMAMVRDGYQPVYRPRSVEFRDLILEQGRPTQRVLVVGPDGVPVVARYFMQRQPDGSWRIDGCVLERRPERTT